MEAPVYNQRGLVISVLIIIGVSVIGGGFYYTSIRGMDVSDDGSIVSQSGSDLDNNKQVSDDGYFVIRELGIKFKVTDDIKDLVYTVQDFGGENNKFVKFSSRTLIDADLETGG